MGRVTVWCCAVGLTGCAQLFGIDNTSSPPDVALPPAATLTIERVAIGATVEVSPEDLTGRTAAYFVADDVETSGLRRIPATLSGNVWTAEVPDGVAAMVEYTLPQSDFKRLLAFPNRDLRDLSVRYQNAALEPAPAGGSLNVSLTLPSGHVSSELIRLYVVGPWTYHNLTAAELPAPDLGNTGVGPVSIPYDDVAFPEVTSQRPTPKITSADRMVVVRYPPGSPQLGASGEVTPFTQSGLSDPVTSTLTTVVRAPLDVDIDPAAIASRLSMSTPAGSAVNLDWNVTAAPGASLGSDLGIQLHAGSVASTTGPTTIANEYGNPFTSLGWPTIMTFSGSRTRQYTPPNMTISVALRTTLQQYLTPAADSKLDLPAPLPVLVLVNATPLTSDGLTVTIDPNKSVKLSLVADRPTSDIYVYYVLELVADTARSQLQLSLIYLASGPTTDITIPAGVMQTGKTYAIRAHCYKGGFPMLAMGDFTKRDLPLSVGFLDSGVFTVAAP